MSSLSVELFHSGKHLSPRRKKSAAAGSPTKHEKSKSKSNTKTKKKKKQQQKDETAVPAARSPSTSADQQMIDSIVSVESRHPLSTTALFSGLHTERKNSFADSLHSSSSTESATATRALANPPIAAPPPNKKCAGLRSPHDRLLEQESAKKESRGFSSFPSTPPFSHVPEKMEPSFRNSSTGPSAMGTPSCTLAEADGFPLLNESRERTFVLATKSPTENSLGAVTREATTMMATDLTQSAATGAERDPKRKLKHIKKKKEDMTSAERKERKERKRKRKEKREEKREEKLEARRKSARETHPAEGAVVEVAAAVGTGDVEAAADATPQEQSPELTGPLQRRSMSAGPRPQPMPPRAASLNTFDRSSSTDQMRSVPPPAKIRNEQSLRAEEVVMKGTATESPVVVAGSAAAAVLELKKQRSSVPSAASPKRPPRHHGARRRSSHYSSYTGSSPSPRRHSSRSRSSFSSYSDRASSYSRSSSGYDSSYSSYSTYSTSSSTCSEPNGVVLALKPGCTAAPPQRFFADVPYRMKQRAALEPFAESAVIYEWNLKEGCWNRIATKMVVSPEPFSHGNMRASYYIIDMKRLNCPLVAKRYLRRSVDDDQYFDDVSMHSISGHWARMYNAMDPPKKVKFVPAAVVELPERSPPLILALEPQLDGQFKKYNNNCGYVPRNARWTPQAFSHFTYHASRHQLMIVDIQGVDDIYTDPQILSPDGEGYGRGNLGMKGIRRFLESHKCNSVCKALGLPPVHHHSDGSFEPVRAFNSRGDVADIEGERLPPKVYKREATLSSSQLGTAATTQVTSPPSITTVPALMAGAPPVYSPGVNGHDSKFMQHIRNAIKRNQTTYFANTAGMVPAVNSPVLSGGGSSLGQASQQTSGSGTPMAANTPPSSGFTPRPPSDSRLSSSGRVVAAATDPRVTAFTAVEERPRRFYNK